MFFDLRIKDMKSIPLTSKDKAPFLFNPPNNVNKSLLTFKSVVNVLLLQVK
jgi:hypothetical protein